MSAVFGLSSVFGPTLGGYIVYHAAWHWIFWVFLPVGVIALVMIWTMFPSAIKREGESVDYLGFVFLTTAIIPLLLAFSWAGTRYDWDSLAILGLFATCAVSIGLFILVELKTRNPALPLYLFKNSVFTVSNLVGFMMGASMFGTIMFSPFFIQGVMGTSPTVSGYVLMPLMLSLVIASAVTGSVITKTGKYKGLALGGLLIMAVGLFLMSTMNMDTTNLHAIGFMIVVGVGLGIGFPIFSLTVQNAIKDRMLGVATASSQLFRQLGGTIGVAIMGTVMSNRMAAKMTELSSADGAAGTADLTAEQTNALAGMTDPKVLRDPAQLEAISQKLPEDLHIGFESMLHMLRESLSYSLSGVFLFGAFATIAAFLLTFLLREIPLRTTMQPTLQAIDDDEPGSAGAVMNRVEVSRLK